MAGSQAGCSRNAGVYIKDTSGRPFKKSKGLLHGEVESSTRDSKVYHRLSIVVPALDNYRFVLLRVHHSFLIYPVFVDESPIANWGPKSRVGATSTGSVLP